MKILLVEDEANVISFLRRGLMEASHEVSVAMDGTTAWDMLQETVPDIIIMDIMLPGMNGVELCRKIRHAKIPVPILMLTALGTSENIVTGLNAGADDYLVKPFKFSELQARIGAIMRRSTQSLGTDGLTLQIEDLMVDTRGKQVTRGDEKINLTATEYNVLEYLVRHQGRVLSRNEILESVWGINFDMNTNVVDVYINYLRRKLEKKGKPKLIHTVVGMGYVLRNEEKS